MMLISETYRKLQQDLHARYNYGHGGDAEEAAEIVRSFNPETVLDYGCGQGNLARLLTCEVEQYDPAIEGKTDDPARADVVVCTDVLEHIEPDCLDDVLLHLRALTKNKAVFIIATKPSSKVMADGRGAHLIVEDSGFWFQKLTGLFNFERFEDRSAIGKGLLIVVTPREIEGQILPITRIKSASAVDDTIRNDQVRVNCRRIERRLGLKVMAHDRTAHLACFGPSLKGTWPELAIARAKGEEVYTVSGAHDFLIERGVTPIAHLDCDPREHKAKMVTPQHGIEYWLASCVHPSYTDKLAGHSVALWHSYNGEASKEVFDIDPGHKLVVGGGSIGLRAMSVLYCRGFRNFEVHGMDCCFQDGEHHAGTHLGINHDAARVMCNERWFYANAQMILYAQYFQKQMRMLPDAVFNFHGDGLLAEMCKTGEMQ